MEFLKNLGFSDLDIEEIKNANSEYVIDNIELNKVEVASIVKYLLEIGIEKDAVKDIFKEQVNMFFKTKAEISESFDEYEIDTIVKSLNFDVNNIEMIDFI